MSKENLEIVRRFYADFNSRGVAAVHDHYHPAIEWHDVAEFPDTQIHEGLEAAARALQAYVDLGGEIEVQVEEMRDLGDEVFVIWRYEGRGTASGVPLENTLFHLWLVKEGKLVRLRQFLDRRAALEAAGLSGT